MKTSQETQLQEIWKELPAGGLIAQGSPIKRHYQRTVKGNRRRYGPYYSWTRKTQGKTQTVALSHDQYERLREAIRQQREVLRILAKLYAASEHIIRSDSQGVAKRRRLPKR